jgi:hypothetical protein
MSIHDGSGNRRDWKKKYRPAERTLLPFRRPPAFREPAEQAQPAPTLNYYHPLTKAEGRTDVNNAARLVARYGEVIRWVGPWDKWLIWDGSRWKVDQALAIDRKAKDVAAGLFAEIAAILRGGTG